MLIYMNHLSWQSWLEVHSRGLKRGSCLARASLWERTKRCWWGRRRAWCWSWLQLSWHWACLGTATARCPSRPRAGKSQPEPPGSWQRAPHSQHCCLILWKTLQTARGHQNRSSGDFQVFKISTESNFYLQEMKLLLACVLTADHVLNDWL